MRLPLDKTGFVHYNNRANGVWRSLVSRLVRDQEASGSNPDTPTNPAEIFRFQPDFSMFSEHFPMENSVTFPFDPNVTQTGF